MAGWFLEEGCAQEQHKAEAVVAAAASRCQRDGRTVCISQYQVSDGHVASAASECLQVQDATFGEQALHDLLN